MLICDCVCLPSVIALLLFTTRLCLRRACVWGQQSSLGKQLLPMTQMTLRHHTHTHTQFLSSSLLWPHLISDQYVLNETLFVENKLCLPGWCVFVLILWGDGGVIFRVAPWCLLGCLQATVKDLSSPSACLGFSLRRQISWSEFGKRKQHLQFT